MISKDQRQEEIVEKIIANKGKGYLDIVGGFGKTITVIKFILRVLDLRPSYFVNVIVPTDELKEQWEASLDIFGVANYKVQIINGVAEKNIPLGGHITILDEAHLWLRAPIFSRIFRLSNSPYVIPMSGTWTAEDRRIMQSLNFPLIDKITQEEAEANGWVSKSIEYNLGLDLTEEDRAEYDMINQRVDEYFALFGHDFNDAQSCTNYGGSLSYIRRTGMVRPGFTDEMLAKELARKANIWQEFTLKRSNFINTHVGKLQAVADILNNLQDRKAITFGLLQAPAEQLTSLIFDSKAYHSGLNTIYIKSADADRYGFKTKKDSPLTKISKKNLRRLYIAQFKFDEFRVLNTVKAADLGLDVRGVNCAIIYARNSKGEKNYQRIWRATRMEGDFKLSLLINIYIKGSQDQKWLRACQKGKRGIVNVNSVDELIEDFRRRVA